MSGRLLGLETRSSLGVAFIVAASCTAVGYSMYASTSRQLVAREDQQLVHEASRVGFEVRARVDQLRADVSYLSGALPLAGIVRASAAGGMDPAGDVPIAVRKAELEELFGHMLRTRPDYAQIRLIGLADGGRELVRAERFGGDVRYLRGAELQRKGRRRYVVEAAAEEPGRIYLSRFELNRENGRVSEPLQPVIRGAVALEDGRGGTFGLLVINLAIDSAFANLPKAQEWERIYLVNEQGDFLRHPDAAKTLRAEIGRPHRLGDEFPSLLPSFRAGARQAIGLVEDETGTTWTLGMVRQPIDPMRPARDVIAIVAEPRQVVQAASSAARDQALAVSGALILLGAGAGFAIARRITRQIGGEPAHIEAITRRVADGDLDIELPDPGAGSRATGILASVERMVVALHDARALSQRSDWIKTQISEGFEATQRATTMDELAGAVLSWLARATDSVRGGFYLRRPDSDPPDALELLRGFAHDPERGAVSFRLGEGLVGQCALEAKMLVYDRLPRSYAASGAELGPGEALHLILVPVCALDRTLAVVELLSFEPYDDLQRELLDRAAPSLGVAIQARLGLERTTRLLAQTQELSARAQAQAEELRAANEELSEKGRALAEQTDQLESQAEELRAANEELSEKSEELQRQATELTTKNANLQQMRASLEEKARDLARASEYKSEFLTKVSHELRTPLNTMLLLTGKLAKDEDRNLTAAQREEIGVLERSGQDLLGLINQLLDLSKIEAGIVELRPGPVSLAPFLESLRAQFEPLAEECGVAFEVACEADVPYTIETDEPRLRQALRNLLGNAFKFTDAGHVRLEVARRPAPASAASTDADGARADRIAFAVADTGVGIPEDRQAAVFESFVQVGTTSREQRGSGLGLAIARQLAGLLGGEIELVSALGEGSTFTLVVPIDLVAPGARDGAREEASPIVAAAQGAPLAAAPVPDARVVLIVEDDADLAGALADIVRRRGHEARIATDGETALELARSSDTCAVLLDIGLPDIDGAEVLARLKRDVRTAHVPVHVVTGVDVGSELLRKGAVQILRKPVALEAVESIFERADKRQREVLVLDRDEASRSALRKLIESARVMVFEADGSGDPFAVLTARRYDCVVIDHELCDARVSECLQTLVESSPDGRPVVIVQTPPEISVGQERALHAFASALVVKGEAARARLIDELALFLHSLEGAGPAERRRRVSMLAEPNDALKGQRVLVVDDDVRNAFALSRVLRDQGLEVVLADDGRLALERLRDAGPFGAVLMDLMMPEMDGYEAIREIRSDPALANLPIIALTARAMESDREACMEAGADDYLTKPLDPDRLLSILRIWLVGRV